MSVQSSPIAEGWLNENSLREYPFHEGCGLRPNDSSGALVSGGWTLPNCLVVDMSLSVSGSSPVLPMHLGRMSVVGGAVTLVFCGESGEQVMSLAVDSGSHVKNTAYEVSGVGSFRDARGVVVIGDLDRFLEMTPEGAYSFSPSETMVEPTCIFPSSAGVRSLVAVDAIGMTEHRLSGDVRLVAGENIRFDYDPSTNSLVVSADPNSGYSEDCDCGGGSRGIVRSINGISVSDVEIVGDDCVKVEKEGGVLRISDTCARPCCGCAETAFINQAVNDIQTSVGTLSGNVSSLSGRLSEFITSYVLSRKTMT